MVNIDDVPAGRWIVDVCDEIKYLLLDKNRKYKNAALEPRRTFSKASAIEQLNVRIDDKLNRIENGNVDEDEDVVLDLIGYLVLLKVKEKMDVDTGRSE